MFIASPLTLRPALQRSAMSPARDAQVEHVFAPLERGEPFRDRAFYKHSVPTGRGVFRKLFLRNQELDLAHKAMTVLSERRDFSYKVVAKRCASAKTQM